MGYPYVGSRTSNGLDPIRDAGKWETVKAAQRRVLEELIHAPCAPVGEV